MKNSSSLKVLMAFAVALFLCAASVSAQRLSRSHYEDPHNGFRFRPPDDWVVIPTQAGQLEAGLAIQMEGDGRMMTFDGRTFDLKPELKVFHLPNPEKPEPREPKEGEASGEDAEPTPEEIAYQVALERMSIASILRATVGGYEGIDPENPEDDDEIKGRGGLEGRHREWVGKGYYFDVYVDVFEFDLGEAKLFLTYLVADKVASKWRKIFNASAKSVEQIEVQRSLEFEEGGTYEDIIAYHEELVTRTPGWRVIPTPSQRFLIKTSSDNTQFVEEVIERLELSRDLFERDFPPTKPINDVSVVRICGSEEEFHAYGGTSSGVGGWFSPRTAELVLFDYRATDRNATYAVMSHEAFHQYCFYLFDRSEAHRWFDEGHGDYYGGAKFSRGKAKITPKMPAGFDRFSVIKSMVQRDEQVPLTLHLNFSHSEWQSQGPSNVSCYAQSWSIIYMLRRGALGDVSRRNWREEYADIIPNYITTLQAGFRKAYAELLEEREAMAKVEGRELTEDEREFGTSDLGEGVKDEIWREAMAASWGQIDLDEFEQHWLAYVRKEL